MKPRQKRLAFIVGGIAGVAIAAGLILNALKSNVALFITPSEVVANQAPKDRLFRLGGMVKEGSLKRDSDGLTVRFDVTDTAQDVTVVYTGILPDLFREGQGVVTQGRLGSGGVFEAQEVLAKHDETYMAPEVKKALEDAETARLEKTGQSVVTQ
jgi:cytochrome c-type biogenesis protein CcmE